ncbi:hypothetical protein [Prauserella rugosa]|uniref:Uncharacterized protein n=1 Tax=Prauserella rugosa TaxID=43354 RepID=A0A660CDD0_9PSEU|nr:hypothetical protein [Prauserella rugosa]KMS91879.1 hypothetical protein ACZ91_07495 [Streptomyces regensis]TWH21336.1 hypothetical protein JD82_03198 [Prauserella rugosa]
MSGSVEVRQFLLRQDGGGQLSGVGGLPGQRSGHADAPRVSDDQVRRARIAVASGAQDAEDCAQLLDMLGLTPDDEGNTPVQR